MAAQNDVFPIRVYTHEDGLRYDFRKIRKDGDGFLWILYQKGLQRFDGKHMHLWFEDQFLHSMVVDETGCLWISLNDTIYRFNKLLNSFEQVAASLGHRKILLELPGNGPCYVSEMGVMRFNQKSNRFEICDDCDNKVSDKLALNALLVSNFEHVLFYTTGDTIWKHDLVSGEKVTVYFSQLRNIIAISENEIVLSNWENRAWYYNFSTAEKKRIFWSEEDPALVIFDALPSKNGSFFLATYKGLFTFCPENGKLQNVNLMLSGQEYPVQRYRTIFRGEGNRIWACTENSLLFFEYSDNNFNFITNNKFGNSESTFNSDVRAFAPDNQGNLWLATSNGLTQWKLDRNEFKTIFAKENSENYLNHSSIRGLVFDGKNLIIGQTNKGIWIYNPLDHTFQRPVYSADSSGEALKLKCESDFVNQILTLRNGDHLVSAHHGAYLLRGETYEISKIRLPELYGQLIFAFQSRNGQIFIGSGNGLYAFSESLEYLKEIRFKSKLGFTTMMETDSSFILGTLSGLYQLSRRTEKIEPFLNAFQKSRINILFKDDRNSTWIVTDSEVFKYDLTSETLYQYGYQENIRGDFFHPNSYYRDQKGLVFIGGTNGVNTFYPEKIQPKNGELRTRIASFHIPDYSKDNLLQDGHLTLQSFQNNLDLTFETPYFSNPDDITYWYQLKKDDDWYEHGSSNKLLLWNLLPGDYALKIGSSLKGQPIKIASQGIYFQIMHPVWQRSWFIGSVIAGFFLIGLGVSLSFRRKLRDARLLSIFATSLYGQGSVDNILWDTARNCVRILGFVDCVIYLLDERRAMLIQKAAFGLKNPYGREIVNLLEIPVGKGIVGLVAQTGQAEIVNNTRKSKAYIPDAEPALSEITVPIFVDGKVYAIIDSEHPAKRFFKAHHLLLLKKVAGICEQRISRYLTEENVRSRIARDLHDEMGSSLTSIHILSKLAGDEKLKTEPVQEQFLKINRYVAGIMENLSEMVWNVNPENDNFQKLMYHIKEYAAERLEDAGIHLRFHELENAKSIRLNPEQTKNIYLIAKESLNNAVKYSGASLLQIEFLYKNEGVEMSIRDNGQGFDIDLTQAGNGLKNMKVRAEDIGGSFSVLSEMQSGTHVVLRIPIKREAE